MNKNADSFCFQKSRLTVSKLMKISRFRSNRNYRYKLIGIHNIFTLALYNRNWLLDVVTVNPLN